MLRSADILVCGFTGLSSPVFLGMGDWKVARTRRLESLRYPKRKVRPKADFLFQNDNRNPAQLTPMPMRNSMLLPVFLSLPSNSSIDSTGGTPVSALTRASRLPSMPL